MNILTKALGFDSAKASVRTEVVAGATTFLTMSYILAVNPAILATTGMDKGALFTATALAGPFPPCCLRLWPSCRLPKLQVWVSMPSLPLPCVRLCTCRGNSRWRHWL